MFSSNHFFTFFIRVLSVFLVLSALIYISQYVIPLTVVSPFIWHSLLFFTILTIVVFLISMKGIKSAQQTNFTTYIMGSMIIKFMIAIIFFLIYIAYVVRDNKISFVVAFLCFYIIFTWIAIKGLLKAIPENKNKLS